MTVALEPGHTIRQRNERAALKLLLTRGELAAALALAAACIYFTIAAPAFATATNVRGVMTDISIVLLVALGQNLVILAGEIDVSVGSILALSAVSAGFVAQETGALLTPLLIALAAGVACGIVNGLLVTRFGVPSVVVTLGGLFVYRGISLIVASGREVVSVPSSIRQLQTTERFGLPLTIVLILGLFVVLAILHSNVPVLRDLHGDRRQPPGCRGERRRRAPWDLRRLRHHRTARRLRRDRVPRPGRGRADDRRHGLGAAGDRCLRDRWYEHPGWSRQ